MPIERITTTLVAGSLEPVTLAEAKSHLRITHAEDDAYITTLITAVRGLFERLTRRAVPKQDVVLALDAFPGMRMPWWDGEVDGALASYQRRAIDLAMAPTISVTEVASYDLTNTRLVFASTNYFLEKADPNIPGRICLNIGAIWPVNLRRADAVEILFKAGYENGSVPAEIRLAILMLLAHLYANRGEADDVAVHESGAYSFLRQFMVMRPGTRAIRDDRERSW